MSTDTRKSVLQSVRSRKYLNKSFDPLRQDIVEYARSFYDDKIRDFSESGLGGALVDFAAYVGDNLSFYLDHQFTELDPATAIETTNLQRQLKRSGVNITGASPAVVTLTFFVEVPAEADGNGGMRPAVSALPIIQQDTITLADNGTQFITLEDVDFTAVDTRGNLRAGVQAGQIGTSGLPKTFILSADGHALSGQKTQESFPIGTSFIPFRQIVLSNPNVSEIFSVTDDLGNVYYQVSYLSQDVVYKRVPNTDADAEIVPDNLAVLPAPYRFIVETSISSRQMSLTFGGGSADTIADDVIPDPTDFALPLYGRQTFSRTSIDPGTLLSTKSLGVAATNTTLFVSYQYGGGLSHNVAAGTIKNVTSLKMIFPNGASPGVAASVRRSTDVKNLREAKGGDDPPTIDDLRSLVPIANNSQSRVVEKRDLLARIYTLPTNFGRVFRAGVRTNVNNPLVAELFIVSRDANSRLVTSPDTLKLNLMKYVNTFRLTSDAIDIFDAPIVNLQVTFTISVDRSLNKNIVLQSILTKLQTFFDIKNFTVDQPIIVSDVRNIIFNTTGVTSVNGVKFASITGQVGSLQYSDFSFDPDANMSNDMLLPPKGGIFEIKFPQTDIVGVAL